MVVSYGNARPIRHTKCLLICVYCQIAKLNVCQMYHSYGMLDLWVPFQAIHMHSNQLTDHMQRYIKVKHIRG